MMERSPGYAGRRIARDDRCVRSRVVERVDRGPDLPARAPVIFREIDFDPRIAATLDGPERTPLAERPKGCRQPFPNGAAGDQAVHLLDEYRCACPAELSDADVLAIGLCRIDALGNRGDAPCANLDFHLLVRILAVTACRDQQGIVVARRQQILEQLLREEHVTVEDDESVGQQIAGDPQRVQAVGRGEAHVLDKFNSGTADAADVVGAVAGDDGHRLNAAGAQRRQLSLEQRAGTDTRETLRKGACHASKASPSAGSKYDGSHARSQTARVCGPQRPPSPASSNGNLACAPSCTASSTCITGRPSPRESLSRCRWRSSGRRRSTDV